METRQAVPGTNPVKAAGRLLRDTFHQWRQDNVFQMAAALAFYSLFSLAPAVLIMNAMAGFIIGGGTAQNEIIDRIRAMAGEETAAAILALIGMFREGGSGMTAIGVITLMIGATAVFADLQGSLNTIWRAVPKTGPGVKGALRSRVLSFLMVLGIGFFLIASLGVTASISALTEMLGYRPALPGFLGPFFHGVLSLLAFTLFFAMIYKVLPDVRIMWSDVWIGAAVTGCLFTLAQWLIGLYLGNRLLGPNSGRAGSLLVFLLWIYFSAQIFFFGAEFTHVYAEEFGSRILPSGETQEATAKPFIDEKSVS